MSKTKPRLLLLFVVVSLLLRTAAQTPLHFSYCVDEFSIRSFSGQADACAWTKTTSGIFVAPACRGDRAASRASRPLHHAKRGLGS